MQLCDPGELTKLSTSYQNCPERSYPWPIPTFSNEFAESLDFQSPLVIAMTHHPVARGGMSRASDETERGYLRGLAGGVASVSVSIDIVGDISVM
ncbi:uncharacterized protein ColSpa_11355 [Colletotrichum spaethianum]|uniref:Uncharacterized protein n=1 Tax=Colletotrichum spaethianum TaxID=700344 RepID=A0AA37PFD5_9PEZI|nr:uncharacterized protein ColSpa_11355 [Colletotrichum spaethianum]GKT51174.1 hypothetical protein ColSpa_11355 [Colletotrichum spaethianum]